MVAKAEGGTLFLDEIGDLVPASQIKLLRLLQEREYYPLGTDSPRKTGARFVFATNLAIEKPDEAGKLRKDLLHRLRAHHFRIPPLRERPGRPRHACRPLHREIIPGLGEETASGSAGDRPTSEDLIRFLATSGSLEGMIFDAMVRHQSRTMSLEKLPDSHSRTNGQSQDGRGLGRGNQRQHILFIPNTSNAEGGRQDAYRRSSAALG